MLQLKNTHKTINNLYPNVINISAKIYDRVNHAEESNLLDKMGNFEYCASNGDIGPLRNDLKRKRNGKHNYITELYTDGNTGETPTDLIIPNLTKYIHNTSNRNYTKETNLNIKHLDEFIHNAQRFLSCEQDDVNYELICAANNNRGTLNIQNTSTITNLANCALTTI